MMKILKMQVYEKYFARQIYGVFVFILFAVLALFIFFDMLSELGSVVGRYTTLIAFFHVMLQAPTPLFIAWLALWGITIVGDSPQLSTLTAQNAPPTLVGSVLTFANCIGFAITVFSIELFSRTAPSVALEGLLPWLAVGPAFGLYMLRPLWRPAPTGT